MDTKSGKFLIIFKLFCVLLLCCALSVGVFLSATVFIYAAWHCPPPRACSTSLSTDLIILFIFLSPLFIFGNAAYRCRMLIRALGQSKMLRAAVFAFFALFPLFVFAGFVVYAINGGNH